MEMISSSLQGIEMQLSCPLSASNATYEEYKEVVNRKVTLFQEYSNQIRQSLRSIRNTNTFMIMAINRCIDYVKVNKGLRLIPRNETIDIIDTLTMPLECMKNIQEKIGIVLQAVPREICSHIITDKQWLQENVLCLLSNAVKYSAEGEVSVTLSLVVETITTEEEGNDELENNSQQEGGVDLRSESRDETMSYVSQTCSVKNKFSASPRSMRYRLQSPTSAKIVPINSNMHTNIISDEESFLDQFNNNHVHNNQQQILKNCYLRIAVEDHGIGISETVKNQLFNPFKQAQRLAGGTGKLYTLFIHDNIIII